jgi:type I site-specific restriction-modification system R (restriction) subunit
MLKTKWAQLEVMVGSDSRIKLIARDIIEHFENRLSAIDGKAMVVTMSRRIAGLFGATSHTIGQFFSGRFVLTQLR